MLFTIILTLIMSTYILNMYVKREKYLKINYSIIIMSICFYNIYGMTPKWIKVSFLAIILYIISVIDLKYRVIPNRILMILFIFGVSFNLINNAITIRDMLSGFFIISVPLFIISLILKNSIGGGDIKLMAVAGACLGFDNIIMAFFISSICSFIVLLILLAMKKIKSNDLIPYGPFLSIGIFIASLL